MLVPAAYEEVEPGTNNRIQCGSGPEYVAFPASANPNWAWRAAGNTAALAMELEKREKEAAFDGQK